MAQRLIELDAWRPSWTAAPPSGVTYPDQEGMQVVNKPSDGSQRKNSTAIFLTTGLQPTGELASYYVTPSDSILLSGPRCSSPLPGWTPATSPTSGGVGWSVSSGGGTGRERPLYRRGGSGNCPGHRHRRLRLRHRLHHRPHPDEITLTNEATGAVIAEPGPGGQVDLKASAASLALTRDTCFTWSADEVGTVDANVFTAGQERQR